MLDERRFYLNGTWEDAHERASVSVVNPATEEPIAQIARGEAQDIDRAVAAARAAFASFQLTSRQERVELLEAVLEALTQRAAELGEAVRQEMGAPKWLAHGPQALSAVGHFKAALRVLREYRFETDHGSTRLRREPIGVCGLITPWNWPVNQIACKVAPALAAGCTMVLKPSEESPLSGHVFASALHDAGVPAGVFNLVDGLGPEAGAALSAHPDVDMVSFTGSTRAGVLVQKAAADTVKRVTLELGGKSPNIILDDADLEKAVRAGVSSVMLNSGQSCNAPTRMLVPAAHHERALEIAAQAIAKARVGDPQAEGTRLGPLVNERQFQRVQGLIQQGIDEGARLVAGGTGRPEGLARGYYVRPTVFGGVDNQMAIAREEIFGPVLAILPYEDEQEAVRIANDTPYGLSSYVQSGDPTRAARVAKQIRAGMVHINGAQLDNMMPFGGYKQSGNGREWGEQGLEEFLEIKAMMGYCG